MTRFLRPPVALGEGRPVPILAIRGLAMLAGRQEALRLASFALAVAFGFVFGSPTRFIGAAAAEIDPRTVEFVASLNKIIAESKAQPGAQTRQACDRIVTTAIDLDALIQSAMGPVWARMSPRQRGAFRTAAERWAVRDCVLQNEGNEGSPLELLGLKRGASGERLLATRSSHPAHTIVWRLRGAGMAPAEDVAVDGRSAALSLRNETKALLDRNHDDIDAATEMLGR